MDPIELETKKFWGDQDPIVFFNTRSAEVDEALVLWVKEQEELKGHLLFATSGTTSTAKWVCLSKKALLLSAKAVNRHLGIARGDRWFRALPLFHVGGFALSARAFVSAGSVVEMEGDWSAVEFGRQLEESESHWVSLVPTQLSDIVLAGVQAPAGLKGVIIGGGSARKELVQQASLLGWPILQSYGMSEAGSQLATARVAEGKMELLEEVEVKLEDDSSLSWKSSFMYSGYVKNLQFSKASEWCATKDKVRIGEGTLEFISRADRVVKILGELVDVEALEVKVNQGSDQEVVLLVRDDERRGCCLVPVVEDAMSKQLSAHLQSFRGLELLENGQQKTFPRNLMGKVMKRKMKLI